MTELFMYENYVRAVAAMIVLICYVIVHYTKMKIDKLDSNLGMEYSQVNEDVSIKLHKELNKYLNLKDIASVIFVVLTLYVWIRLMMDWFI